MHDDDGKCCFTMGFRDRATKKGETKNSPLILFAENVRADISQKPPTTTLRCLGCLLVDSESYYQNVSDIMRMDVFKVIGLILMQ